MEIGSPEDFKGISVGNKLLLELLMKSIALASSLQAVLPDLVSREVQRIAALSAMHTVNSLLVVASAKCTIDTPPADIGALTDGSGNLIYRCQHKQPHNWDMYGHRI